MSFLLSEVLLSGWEFSESQARVVVGADFAPRARLRYVDGRTISAADRSESCSDSATHSWVIGSVHVRDREPEYGGNDALRDGHLHLRYEYFCHTHLLSGRSSDASE